jgi:hypothetical protein
VLVVLKRGTCEVFSWHASGDISSKIHDDPLRHSSNVKVITSTILEAAVLVLLMGVIYEARR